MKRRPRVHYTESQKAVMWSTESGYRVKAVKCQDTRARLIREIAGAVSSLRPDRGLEGRRHVQSNISTCVPGPCGWGGIRTPTPSTGPGKTD